MGHRIERVGRHIFDVHTKLPCSPPGGKRGIEFFFGAPPVSPAMEVVFRYNEKQGAEGEVDSW
jgi:hypothetical protein